MKFILISLIAAALTASVPTATSASAAPDANAPAVTRIELQGAVNVRDIGGYRTYDGAQVRSGKVVRADALNNLTPGDVRTLAGLNLQTVVDLRTRAEIQAMGADKLPPGVPLVARPIDDTGLYLQMMQVIRSADPQRQQQVLGDGGAERIMANVYRSFLSDDSRAKFGATIRDLANTDGPTLYHCTAGKDRTGWLTYVTLRAVGVPEQTARQDYLLSNRYRAAADAQLRDQVKRAGLMQDPDLLIPLQEVRETYLDTALQQVQQTYGEFGKFLTQGLGLDPGTILKLRRNLVG
ncbi:tyrosine-protein phosphatase [Nocardia terpenica]|uniref:Protein-tyrosine-phosphatase n=1 Tax=Nocardia terpenica TaxID=455432 RepID=A0A164MZS3_9NOCA|nr:tyrosine-protein phosphatase [Nocardia terpenica]KZM73830.1 protein-tyrosine-phosphatase [Nocardia terpenica]MBF6064569.1 tyrosine-protein phosphatase [Nocardia terpenica]MBF6106807.1 tyrosine-protein phosphatase [Nocardia terpenica]MBF6114537.1 tyrosine-protein phosphatase [Nocardia terpenica]MBF6121377.1 tyrosine-protein phosphatase [Nocardia terpenica]